MSKQYVARYRVPPVPRRSHRTLAERLTVRFAPLARLYGSAFSRLPVESRLRREILARMVRDTAEAWNRRDREVLLAALDPDVELNIYGAVAGSDLDDRYRGHEEYLRYWATIDEVWESNRVEPQEVIDFGDRSLVLYHNRVRGRGSGVEVGHDIGVLVTWSGGTVVRVDLYWVRAEAFEAVGLSE